MFENEITYTIVMTFKDAMGSVRSIKVPYARPNVTGREVRRVMEQIIRDGVFLSRNGLPLVKIVRATLVMVRWIFAAAKVVPKKKAEVPSVQPAVQKAAAASVDIPAESPAALYSCKTLQPLGMDKNNSRPQNTEAGTRNMLYFIPHCRDLGKWRNPSIQRNRGRPAAAA